MEMIEIYQSGQMSQRQITRKYGVSRKTIVDWERKYGNPEKNYMRMEELTPQQELAELRAALKAANEENKTLKYVMRIIQEEYGENVVKKYLPGLPLKKPQTKTKKSK